ncbi:head maturation protease, ClpP-related [Cereibacter sediminicola]|uniref:head maturation protease, ClpP-related n=1 Tax=Cereibacter sediminicola TaxID=2584941 RepID=UPI00119D18E4|nr:head maturation protease, ClpP-related [Cereibacter sediminicola]
MASWYAIRARGCGREDARAEVAIYDEIGAYGVSAKGFLAELGALPDAAPIDLRLNSPGGSVFDAVAIYNALQRHAGRVTVWIDGIAASAASYVAMAGDEIVMPENAFLMIHDPAGLVMGTAGDMRAMAEALDKVKASLVAGYAAKSGRPSEEIAALMAAETWFDAGDALTLGLATRMAEPVRIAARFDIDRFRNAPPALVEAVEAEGPIDAAPDGGTRDDAVPETGTVPHGGSDRGGVADDAADSGAGPAAVADTTARAATPQGHVDLSDMPRDAPDTAAADPDRPPPDLAPSEPAALTAPMLAPADPVAIRAEAIAHARAIVDLCRLAGQPQMAGRFLAQDVGLDEVRMALFAAKAEAEPEIAPHHPQPGRSSAARPWREIVARSFNLKG